VRVLFDHNLPHKLRTSLGTGSKHEIVTASYMGWSELKNGELLRVAEENGIEVLLPATKILSMSRTNDGRFTCLGLMGW
jgi:hypothetical protein